MPALKVAIHTDDSVAHTVAAPLILAALSATRPSPRPMDATGLPASTRVLYAVGPDHNAIVGVLCYDAVGVVTDSEWRVSLAFVQPEERERGVFTALWNELQERALQFGVRLITIAVAPDNHDAVKVLRRRGWLCSGMTFEQAL